VNALKLNQHTNDISAATMRGCVGIAGGSTRHIPITATSFALMYKAPKVTTRSKAAFDFFRWGFRDGGMLASDLGFVPLPLDVVSQIEGYWKHRFAGPDRE
jgi:ABC-type phosphate transport system substrate-binding protein